MGEISEKDLEPVAEKLFEGKPAEAVSALAALLGTATGHTLLGPVAGAAAGSKFFRDPLPGKSFTGQQGRVILPQLWGLPPMVDEQGKVVPTYAKVGNVLAWNDSYLRSDIRMEVAVPPRFTEEW